MRIIPRLQVSAWCEMLNPCQLTSCITVISWLWRELAQPCMAADAMAEQGYIVIATNHPGTTTSDLTSAHARQLWRRPQDLIMALERILNDPLLAGRADVKRIAAVGHSLGGWTVMELAGARFDPQQFAHDCIQHAELSSCRLMTTLGLDNRQGASHLSSDLQDRRIKAVVGAGFRVSSRTHDAESGAYSAARADLSGRCRFAGAACLA